jgi:hypothetical protein
VHVICGYCVQLLHPAPFEPHSVVVLPATHAYTTATTEIDAQHPPLHAVYCTALQAFVHVSDRMLHA